ncbi:MAG: hypothetical protein DRI65_09910, partial [Chloroflexota bacterium]
MSIGDVNNINDAAIGSILMRPPAVQSTEPLNGEILVWSTAHGAYVPQPNIATNGFKTTDDAGGGDAISDLNATDFTGQEPIIVTAADIPLSSITTFVHKDVAYNWVGPTNVTVGLGGSYVAQAGDLVGVGTADHAVLVNLGVIDQHPINAIIGLVTEQTAQDTATALVQTNLNTHVAAPDPHPLYALEAAVLAHFTAAGYGGVVHSVAGAFPDIGGTWQEFTFDAATISTAKGVGQDYPNNGITFASEGVWRVNLDISISFTAENSGRTMNIRF